MPPLNINKIHHIDLPKEPQGNLGDREATNGRATTVEWEGGS